MLVRIANMEDPDQNVYSDMGLPCLSRPFWQATGVQNFRTSIEPNISAKFVAYLYKVRFT